MFITWKARPRTNPPGTALTCSLDTSERTPTGPRRRLVKTLGTIHVHDIHWPPAAQLFWEEAEIWLEEYVDDPRERDRLAADVAGTVPRPTTSPHYNLFQPYNSNAYDGRAPELGDTDHVEEIIMELQAQLEAVQEEEHRLLEQKRREEEREERIKELEAKKKELEKQIEDRRIAEEHGGLMEQFSAVEEEVRKLDNELTTILDTFRGLVVEREKAWKRGRRIYVGMHGVTNAHYYNIRASHEWADRARNETLSGIQFANAATRTTPTANQNLFANACPSFNFKTSSSSCLRLSITK